MFMCVCFFTTSKDFWSHIWCHSVDGTTYPIKSVCGMVEEETLNTIHESKSQSGPITAMSGSGQSHSGTSHSFYCLPDCHGRFANLRTWEELVLLTLTITSRFQSELAPSSLFPATTLGGHGSLKRLLVNSCWRVGPQRLDERVCVMERGRKGTVCEQDRPTVWRVSRQRKKSSRQPLYKGLREETLS